MRVEADAVRTATSEPDLPRFGQRRQRHGGALALALLLHILAFTILLLQKATPIPMAAERGLKTFLLPHEEEKGKTPEAKTESQQHKVTRAEREAVEPPETPPLPPPPSAEQTPPIQWLQLSRADMAASDIGKISNARPAASAADAGGESRAPAGPGTGPGGATLYPADWYREPSSTELGGYLRPGMPRTGWGQIACRTVARYHVEDCYIIGESPRGSGFARSVMDAAWQFLILPPRINGKAQIGTWVSIRITYTERGGAGPG
jgi:protein TonB